MPQYVVCLSVRIRDVRYRDPIGWNTCTSKIISRLISIRFMLGLTPTWATGERGTPKIRVE